MDPVEGRILVIANLPERQIGHRPDQDRLGADAGGERLREFVEGLGRRQAKGGLRVKLRDEVVVVRVEPFGHLAGMSRAAGIPGARHFEPKLQADRAAIPVEAFGDVADEAAQIEDLVVKGEVAGGDEFEPGVRLQTPMPHPQLPSRGFEGGQIGPTLPDELRGALELPLLADAREAEGMDFELIHIIISVYVDMFVGKPDFAPSSRVLRRLFPFFLVGLTAWAGAQETTVRINVAPGLKFDPARFAVAPGAHVRVLFHNGDDMIHNFVVTAVGERLKVVQAALTLGADGPARNFVPALPEVLVASRALNPSENAELEFVAPATAGVYPYVCTFPGHGFVMYGAMYVGTAMPALAQDRNIPPEVAAGGTRLRTGLVKVNEQPKVVRIFLPDCSPAAIAVGLPGGQSFVFDAAECRVRYLWRDGFIDATDAWQGKGDVMAQVVGRVYCRSPAGGWIRVVKEGKDGPGARKWLGYRLVRGAPEFHYLADGADVRERLLTKGGKLLLNYHITGAPEGVRFVTDPRGGATFSGSSQDSATGQMSQIAFQEGGAALTAKQASDFTLHAVERVGQEPLRYYSMNDVIGSSPRIDPAPGIVGRAYTPGGFGPTPKPLDTGVGADLLKHGSTVMLWYRWPVEPPSTAGAKRKRAPAATPQARCCSRPERTSKWTRPRATANGTTSLWSILQDRNI